jgi:hypothetical protein
VIRLRFCAAGAGRKYPPAAHVLLGTPRPEGFLEMSAACDIDWPLNFLVRRHPLGAPP